MSARPPTTASPTRLDELRRRLRGTSGRGRKLRGLLVLLRPYRWRVVAMFARAGLRHRRVAGAGAAAPSTRSTTGSCRGDLGTLELIVAAVRRLGAGGLGRRPTCRPTSTGWVGQRALQDLRLQIFRHLQEMPVGFYERRPAGVLISRMTNDVEALDSLVTDSVVTLFQASLTLVGHDRDPAAVRRRARADHVRDLPGDGDRLAGVPDRVGRRLQAHARDDRRDHRLPAGVAVGHPRRALVRAGAAAPRALRRAQRGQPRRQHGRRSSSTPPTSRRSRWSARWRPWRSC